MTVRSIKELIESWPAERIIEAFDAVTEERVLVAIGNEQRDVYDLVALLSPKAWPHLERIAMRSQAGTRRYFGRTIGQYAPIYLSNLCAADCIYCGFAAQSGNTERRKTLSMEELEVECKALTSQGLQSLLIVTGEAPKKVDVHRIAEAVRVARRHFPSVSVEIYALDDAGYEVLVEAGVEGVTLYMETYHRPTYQQVHLLGEKTVYDYRLDALTRAGRAGVRRLNLGALLGLYDWRAEVVWAALHAKALQKTCWQSAVSLSFPRLRHTPERFEIPSPVDDRSFVQLMLALRLFLPEVGFNLSTREPPALRDRLIPLGITMMSAGSSTRPGGCASTGEETLQQFALEDTRSPAEVAQAVRRAGYEPVWKDFDEAFHSS